MMFVYLMTIIISAGWLVRSLQIKKFEIARTPLDIPLFLFLASQITSTILSLDWHTSIWGYYSRFHGGLASTICYVILFYALVTHFANQTKAIKNLITAILVTAAITCVYAVLEKLGIDKNIWVQDVQNRVFSTLGQPNWLSAYIVAILPIALYRAIANENKDFRLTYWLLSVLFLAVIFFTKSQSGIGATMVVLTAFAVVTAIQNRKAKLLFIAIPLILLLIIFKRDALGRTLNSLNKTNPFYSDATTIITEENKTRLGGSDSMAIRRVVWQGAIELGKRYPFFGTGVETFGYTYYWVRPVAHNLTSESDFLYNKAHNEFLNFLANTGFIGLGTYLLLIFAIGRLFVISSSQSTSSSRAESRDLTSSLSTPFFLGFIGILVTNYFGFSVVNVALFFFLFPAIILAESSTQKFTIDLSINSLFGSTIIICTAIWMLLGVRNMWVADVNYTIGKNSLDENTTAIKLNPKEPLYYAQKGYVQALVAAQIILPQVTEIEASAPAELKERASKYLNDFITDSLANVNKSVAMNPYNLNLLKSKARTELYLATLDPKYNFEAIKTLLKVTELSPNEASNYYNIGLLYKNLGTAGGPDSKTYLEQAKVALQKAIDLKSDHMAARDLLNSLK